MRKTTGACITLYETDFEVLNRLSGDLGMSKSAVVRVALRSFEKLVKHNLIGTIALGANNE